MSPRELRLEEFKRPFDAVFINRFEAGKGTRYSIVAAVRLKGVARALGPLVTPIVRTRLDRPGAHARFANSELQSEFVVPNMEVCL